MRGKPGQPFSAQYLVLLFAASACSIFVGISTVHHLAEAALHVALGRADTGVEHFFDKLTQHDDVETLQRALNRGTRSLVYHHIHKSGGSSMCYALHNSGAKMLSCKDDQVPAAGDTPHDLMEQCNCNGPVSPSPIATLPPQQVHTYLTNHSWAAALFNEDGLAEPPYFGPAAVQVAIVRHPTSRYISHMLNERAAWGLEPFNAASRNLNAAILNHTAGGWPLGSYPDGGAVPDNYNTRFFAGYSALGSPSSAGVHNVTSLPPVTTEMFLRAVDNLARMDAVLVMEHATGPEAGRLLAALGLRPFRKGTRRGTSFSRASRKGATDSALSALWPLHEYDMLLYSIAERRHQRLMAAWAKLEERQQQRRRAGRKQDAGSS